MHELSIAQNILDIVREHVPAGEQVRRVRVKIGELSGVVPESLEFCLSVIAQGTGLEGLVLDLVRVPLIVRCGSCGRESNVDPLLGVCPLCGGTDTVPISGTELQVVEIELLDGP